MQLNYEQTSPEQWEDPDFLIWFTQGEDRGDYELDETWTLDIETKEDLLESIQNCSSNLLAISQRMVAIELATPPRKKWRIFPGEVSLRGLTRLLSKDGLDSSSNLWVPDVTSTDITKHFKVVYDLEENEVTPSWGYRIGEAQFVEPVDVYNGHGRDLLAQTSSLILPLAKRDLEKLGLVHDNDY